MVEWEKNDLSAKPLHYVSENDKHLYINDTHRGRLRKTGDRYHLVYDNPGEYRSTLTASNSFDELETLVEQHLTDSRGDSVNGS